MEYHSPTSIEEVSSLLAVDANARILAGGTDLLVQMHSGLVDPSQIVDIKALPGISAVELNEQGLTLGAAAPAQSITEREDIKAVFPGHHRRSKVLRAIEARIASLEHHKWA